MAEVNLRKVVKRYDDVEAVRGIDLDIADHEFVVLVGPSGCGKSTTLRMIAGLEDISDGDIMIGGDVVIALHHLPQVHFSHRAQPFVAPAVRPAM